MKSIKMNELHPYDIGIVWALGSLMPNKQIVFKHKNQHFLDRISLFSGNKVYMQEVGMRNTSFKEYVLKTAKFDLSSLQQHGWASNYSGNRRFPKLPDYKDFLRAYFEIHSGLGYTSKYRTKKTPRDFKGNKYLGLRLRVYGNEEMIKSINHILHTELNVTKKTINILNNKKTAVLTYTSTDEINRIYNYLFGSPYDVSYWDKVRVKLAEPIKEIDEVK